MREVKRLGVIGCGMRADCYLSQMAKSQGQLWDIAALADLSPIAIKTCRRRYGNVSVPVFRSGPELLSAMGEQLDAVIISSPNSFHLESLLPALDRRLTILLEKPVGINIADCAAAWQAYQKAGSPAVAVGFVLRYTAFYQKVRQLLDDGRVGQVLSIEASEALGPALTSVFMRTWRRKKDLAGPILLEKCAHDMDLLNWLAGARPVQVSSFADRTRFIPNPEAAMHCADCCLTGTCRYWVGRIAPYLIDTSMREATETLISHHNDLCVFNSDKEIWDHQVVNIRYANGVLANFSLSTDQPRTTRRIRIDGTMGQIVGDIGRDELRLEVHGEGNSKPREEIFQIQHDSSGHHGGDSIISRQFQDMLSGRPTPPLAGLREGIDACLVALTAEESVETGQVVEIPNITGA